MKIAHAAWVLALLHPSLGADVDPRRGARAKRHLRGLQAPGTSLKDLAVYAGYDPSALSPAELADLAQELGLGDAPATGGSNPGAPNQGTAGRCRVKGKCTTSEDCKDGRYCKNGEDNTSKGCQGTCIEKLNAGGDCGKATMNMPFDFPWDPVSEACKSGNCLCGTCAESHTSKTPTAVRCSSNDDCESEWCQPSHEGAASIDCTGVCEERRSDGESCFNGDRRSCASQQCTFGKCGINK